MKKRKKAQMVEDRANIAVLLLKGDSQRKIADRLSLSQSTINRDIKAIQKMWVKATIRDFNVAKAEELAKIDLLEREYWASWERSKEKKVRQSIKEHKGQIEVGDKGVENKPGYRDTSVITEQLIGDVKYLAGVQWCIERRCKILGFDAPVAVDLDNEFVVYIKTEDGLIDPRSLYANEAETDPHRN